MKRKLRIVVPLTAVSAICIGLFSSGVLGRKASNQALTLYGNVDIRQVEIGFRVSGRVAEMRFEEGDAIAAGTLLARLDDRTYAAEERAAEAQVAQQSALLAKLERGPRSGEIGQARASLAERRANLVRAEQSFKRINALQRTGARAQSDLDDAQSSLLGAQAAVQNGNQTLRLLREGTRVEDVAAARASLEVAKAHLATVQASLADTRLLAPADGVILSRVREAGAIVAPSDNVYVVSLLYPVWVRSYVDESNLGRIIPGMPVDVLTDSSTKPYQGKVGFVSPVAEFTPKSVETPDLRTDLVYRLRILIEEIDPTLRQGMPVTVKVRETSAQPRRRAPDIDALPRAERN